ncbi:telomerase reverse transcriptase-like [Microplitis mediator]|uniref:telomerase reverse transcriptase-like n=1 Tax=Microplitis mediator TaxID=375433 RepID=UPI002553CC69|nr:telomerase reverse transcriptase-like [Microplitis mediator]XP_057318421.1 telomerase reverse transcriptase-like [Microplitis mediator]
MDKTPGSIDWTPLKKSFGPMIVDYMRDNNYIPKKSKLGAYILPPDHEFILDEWGKFEKGSKKKSDKSDQISEDKSYLPQTHDLDEQDNFCLFDNFRRSVNLEESLESLPDRTPPRQNTLSEIRGPNARPPDHDEEVVDRKSINRILAEDIHKRNYRNHKKFYPRPKNLKIFKSLLDPTACYYSHYAPYLKDICDVFAKKHLHFQYNILLDSIPQDESLFKGELSKNQLLHFFSQIFYHVVPGSLFGSRRNLKKVKAALKPYFAAAKIKPFTIEPLVEKLDIDSVEWLSKLNSKTSKILVLCRTIKWFFYTFIWNIIDTYFFSENNKTRKEMIYIRRWVKGSVILNYIREQETQNNYQPIEHPVPVKHNSVTPVAHLIVQSKKDGVRPILSNSKTSDHQKEIGKKVHLLLKQLYLKNNDIINVHTLHKIWKSVCETRKLDKTKPIYFVSCDINDAFGSIIQDKLLDIVFELIDKLPDKIPTQWFAVIDSTNIQKKSYKEKEFISPEILPPILPRGALCCRTTRIRKPCTIISKKHLKTYIKSAVVQQRILHGNRTFILKKGIGQGVPMSGTLCDFYYSDMMAKEFSKFTESGHLLRYVDDFLFLTEDKELAQEFLEKIKNGVGSYGCSFNPAKTQSNLSPYNNNEFTYLGYHYDLETLNVKPEYTKLSLVQIMSRNQPQIGGIDSVFVKKIANWVSLKLSALVLDPCINSKEVIIDTLKSAARLCAEKCFFLLLNTYDVGKMTGESALRIFNDIKKKSLQPLLQMCKIFVTRRHRKFTIRFGELKCIFWHAYLKVFRKNEVAYKKFSILIKSQFKSKLLNNLSG